MRSSAATVSFAALLAPALANPLNNIFTRDSACPANDKHYSSNDWCSTKKEDSVVILASDTKVPYGTVNPGDIIGSVRDHCSNGVCETEWSLDTMWVKDRQVTNGKTKVVVATQVTDPVHLAPMLDSLQYTLDRLKDFSKEEWLKPVVCTGSVCPQPEKHEAEQTTGPAGITMQIREKDSDKSLYDRPVVSSLTITLEPEADENFKGVCGALAGVGAAAAGAINPILGVIGAMAQIGCLAAP